MQYCQKIIQEKGVFRHEAQNKQSGQNRIQRLSGNHFSVNHLCDERRFDVHAVHAVYDRLRAVSYTHLTKTILKVVLINFAVLVVLVCIWLFGLIGLVVYSLVLFWLLKRYYDRSF